MTKAVAAMAAARAEDDLPRRCSTPAGRWTWRQSVGRRGGPRRAGRPVAVRTRRTVSRRGVAPQRARVPLLAERGRTGGGRHCRGEPHSAGRGPRRRHQGHRVRAHRDRPRWSRAPDRTGTRGGARSHPGDGRPSATSSSSAPFRADGRRRQGAGQASRPGGPRRRRARRRAVPAHLHLGHHRDTEGRALYPGPPGRHRREWRLRDTGTAPTMSATAPCRCSTAMP